PIYPTTEGLHQSRLRSLIEQALGLLDAHPEALPGCSTEALPSRFRLTELHRCPHVLHQPTSEVDSAQLPNSGFPASRRLALEELLAHRLSLQEVRLRIQEDGAPALPSGRSLQARFLTQLPFSLTAAQRRVLDEIGADLAREVPMLRLVQGDVGSG